MNNKAGNVIGGTGQGVAEGHQDCRVRDQCQARSRVVRGISDVRRQRRWP